MADLQVFPEIKFFYFQRAFPLQPYQPSEHSAPFNKSSGGFPPNITFAAWNY